MRFAVPNSLLSLSTEPLVLLHCHNVATLITDLKLELTIMPYYRTH